jgi:hypothetical protein
METIEHAAWPRAAWQEGRTPDRDSTRPPRGVGPRGLSPNDEPAGFLCVVLEPALSQAQPHRASELWKLALAMARPLAE